MKIGENKFKIVWLLFLFISVIGTAQTNERLTSDHVKGLLDEIGVCRWKNDAQTALNFSFDDNCKSHLQISKILDSYQYKGTFFVISSSMFVDMLKDMNARGHEIGNHTFSHQNLGDLDSTSIDNQVLKGRKMIESKLGIRCVSLAEPSWSWSPLSRRIIARYELFNRSVSDYGPETNYEFHDDSTIPQVMTYIKKQIKSGELANITGHGIEGDGWSPVSKAFFIQVLDSVKKLSDAGKIWVSTLKDVRQYDNLYHEVSLSKKWNQDTLTIRVNGYDEQKYSDLDSSMISVAIPGSLYHYILDTLAIRAVPSVTSYHMICTFDLKKIQQLQFLFTYVDAIKYQFKPNFRVYPNPARQSVEIQTSLPVSNIEIFTINGNLIKTYTGSLTTINLTGLNKGVYLVKVYMKNDDGTISTSWNKIIKE